MICVRIDKYLKVSRLVKRRVVAKELADNDRIEVNGRIVKAGYEVNIGDIILIKYTNNPIKVRVNDIKMVVKKDDDTLFEVL